MEQNNKTIIIFDTTFQILHVAGDAEVIFAKNHACILKMPIDQLFLEYHAKFPLSKNALFGLHHSIKFNVSIEQSKAQTTEIVCVLEPMMSNSALQKSFMLSMQFVEQPQMAHQHQRFCSLVNSMFTNVAQTANIEGMLHHIVAALPGKSHFKRVGDFGYMIANQPTLKLFGMKSPQELVGLSDYEIAKIMKWRWPMKFAQELRDMDLQVVEGNAPIIGLEEKPYLNAEGHVVKHSLTKIPVYTGDQAIGVLTFAIDMACLKDISALRNLYLQLYEQKKEGHIKFLEHIGMHEYLPQLDEKLISITQREFDVLVLCASGRTAKEMARMLNISFRTAEKHVDSLKQKLNLYNKSDLVELYHVLSRQLTLD